MGSMLFSTIGMFTPKGVMAVALAVCVVLAVVSTRAVKKDAAAQKKRKQERWKRTRTAGKTSPKRDQLDTLSQAGILTREEYEEQKSRRNPK